MGSPTPYTAAGEPERVADLIFTEVLREPTRTDWITNPLETIAVGSAPHPLPYEHWFELALIRKDQAKALNIAERIRRHRFFVTQALGGRSARPAVGTGSARLNAV